MTMRFPTPPPDATFAQLVVDADEEHALRFRCSADLSGVHGVDTSGIVDLGCSGSAQISVAGWRNVQERLALPLGAALHVIDLRQEPHVFLNHAAVSWYARHNWGSVGLSDEEVQQLENLRLRQLAQSRVAWLGHAQDIKAGRCGPLVEWTCEHTMREEQALGLAEGHYLRLPVIDHMRPSDAVVDRFVRFVRSLREGAHLHFHCRGGKGRTTMFLALYDMLRNAALLPVATILERQRRLSDYDLARLPAPDSYKAPCIAERFYFIGQFYRYARANPGGRPQLWTEWCTGLDCLR